MEVEDLLRNYNNYKVEIKKKEHRIAEIELEEISVNGSNFEVNGDRRPTGYMSSNIEEKLVKKQDELDRLKKEVTELQAKIDLIDSLLNTLKPFYKKLLEQRYKENINVENLADSYGRPYKSIQRTIKITIKKLNKMLK